MLKLPFIQLHKMSVQLYSVSCPVHFIVHLTRPSPPRQLRTVDTTQQLQEAITVCASQ